MNLSIPPNLYMILSLISGPLSFNYWQATNFAPWLFNLDPDGDGYSTYNDNFASFGFDTNLAALNLQDTIIFITMFVMGVPITLLIVKIKCLQKFKIIQYDILIDIYLKI